MGQSEARRVVIGPNPGGRTGGLGWNLGLRMALLSPEQGAEFGLERAGHVLMGVVIGLPWGRDSVNGGMLPEGPAGKPRTCGWAGLGTGNGGGS